MKRHRLFPLLLLLTVVIILAACGGPAQGKTESLDWEVQTFDYTNQDEESVGLEDLKGEVWLADFVFTNCRTVCPPMTANMSQLQKQLKDEGLDIPIISFSVDPEVDTPQVLKEYGENIGADFSNWHFLTGYSLEEIQQFSKESFKALVEPEPDSDQVMHGTSFYLVDQSGHVVEQYDGLKPPNEDIIEMIKTLR